MTTLSPLRKRVLTAIDFEFSQMDDYELDNWAREIIGLPERPEGDEPFVGWLLPQVEPVPATPSRRNISPTSIELILIEGNFDQTVYSVDINLYIFFEQLIPLFSGDGHAPSGSSGMTPANRPDSRRTEVSFSSPAFPTFD